MIVLIPAYQPDHRLGRLVADLDAGLTARSRIVVVDDGSGPGYDEEFATARMLGAEVLRYPDNKGKGHALKTGFAHILAEHPGQSVVCADSDGQHAVADILAIGRLAESTSRATILGTRRFSGQVPLRSRIGNDATRLLFSALTRVPLRDTQTGLRGYPPQLLTWLLAIPGDRYEYELRTLLRAARQRRPIVQHDIETIYLEANASSHFRPLLDSLRIYRSLLAFLASSLLGFALDTLALLIGVALTGHLFASVVGARLFSGAVNYTVNRVWVFRGRRSVGQSLPRYLGLAIVLLVANVVLLKALVAAGVALLTAKILTEVSLVIASYLVQRAVVFAAGGRRRTQPRMNTGESGRERSLL